MPAKNSKPAAPKAFDVIAPGKAAPSPTGRPIIVSNRPMIKDPMEPSIKSRPITAPPVGGDASHVGRTVGVGSDSKPDPAGQPSDPILSAIDADAPSKGDKRPGDAPAAAEPTRPAPVVTPPKDPAPEPVLTKPAPAASDPIGATPQPAPSSDPVPAPADSIADDDVGKKDSAIDRPQPGDVAAAEKASAAEKAAAAERAAQEKIIASGQYYLPIASTSKRRGVRRAVLVLLLVIMLGLVWLDIAMDAGIIHIHGVQPLTHFFNVRQ